MIKVNITVSNYGQLVSSIPYIVIAIRSWRQKGWCNKPTKLKFQSILKTENFDALKRYESTETVCYIKHVVYRC